MKQLRFGGMLLSAVLLAAAVVSAQAPAGGAQGQGRAGGAPPAPLKNLKVFPKEMTQAQIIPIMRSFSAALQVDCGHCHQWVQGGTNNDFSVDVKPQKDIARAMLTMVNAINPQIQTGVSATGVRTGDAVQKVTCATCHRGKPIPQVETYPYPVPAPGARPGGAGAAAPGGAPAGGARGQ